MAHRPSLGRIDAPELVGSESSSLSQGAGAEVVVQRAVVQRAVVERAAVYASVGWM